MEHPRSISAVICDACSLGAAIVALIREYPELTIESVIAAESAEILEMGWSPSSRHRDCAYLLSIAELLKPILDDHGNLTLEQAFRRFVESGHQEAGQILAVLEQEPFWGAES